MLFFKSWSYFVKFILKVYGLVLVWILNFKENSLYKILVILKIDFGGVSCYGDDWK